MLRFFKNVLLKEKNIKKSINKDEVIHMYEQLVKMKLRRPDFDVYNVLNRCFPDNEIEINQIINNYFKRK